MNLGGVGRDFQGRLISSVGAGVLVMLYFHGEEFQVPGYMITLRISEVGVETVHKGMLAQNREGVILTPANLKMEGSGVYTVSILL